MNKLVIPPPPSWYENNILACAPDNTVIYASRHDVVVINPKPLEEPAHINILPRCHRDRIVAIVVCPKWGDPDKLAASIADDKVVNLIDIATSKVKLAHSGHTTRSDKLVGVTFAGHDRIISVSEDGFIVIWRWVTNQLNSLSELLGSKIKVTCVSSCPHATWLTAFGLRKGEILITDLRKTGRILHRLRGHDTNIISLSWCPTPYNVFPKNKPKITQSVNKVEEVTQRTESLDQDASSILQTVTQGISSINVASNCCKDQIETEEHHAIVPKHDEEAIESISPELEHIREDDSTEDVVEENQATVDELAKGTRIESISANLEHSKGEASTEDVAENTSAVAEDKDGNVICENACSKSEIGNKVVDVKDLSEIIFFKTPPKPEIDSKVVNITKLSDIVVSKTIDDNTSPENKLIISRSGPSSPVLEIDNKVDIIKGSADSLLGKSSPKLEIDSKVAGIENSSNIIFSKTIDPISALNSQASKDVTEDNSILPIQALAVQLNENQEVPSNGFENIEPNASPNIENSLLNIENENQQPSETPEPIKEYLLASSSRGGRSINIWRAGTDGIKQAELYLPVKPRGNQRSYHPEEKSWITICWVTPKNLLSSSPKGELYQWNLAKTSNTRGGYKWRLIHGDHHNHIFGIAAPIRLHESPDDEDWREKNLLNAWTVGRDRFILNTSLCSERKTLASYQTIIGSVNCLSPSAIYPSKIAIGAGEGSCKLWDLSRPHLQYNIMTNFSEKSQHKIVSLAWHPTKETILAFGTTDGRIGYMDPCNSSKSALYFVQYANSAVHRLDWGPTNVNHEDFLLYAVIAGKLIAFDVNKRLDAPIVFDVVENVTQMCWKPDRSVCAVANKAGHVSLFSPEMKLLTTLYLQNKSVRWITWHPEATVEDDGVSPYANWLAVATNDVTVYDCSMDDNDSKSDYSKKIVAIFKEHTKFVDCLSWSTFEGGKLASASDDGTAMVWNVKTKTLLHTCVMPSDVLTSVLWSPLDPDYIITGSKSSILKIWKLSENHAQEKRAKKQHHKQLKLQENEGEAGTVADSGEEVEEVEEIEKPKKSHSRFVLAGLIEAQNRNSAPSVLNDCKRLFAVHYGNTDNNSASENGNDNRKQLDVIKIFGNDTNLQVLLDLERNCASKRKLTRASSHICIWQGNTGKIIKQAIVAKTLNPWLISMAPTVSHDLYLEACETYADHLSEDITGNIYEAVSYYLACHKSEKAIELLCTSGKYLEALVLAKCRLVPTDPLITTIIERWAEQSMKTGAVEVAAQCYIALNRPEKAAKALFKRTDEESLKLCAELAKLGEDKNFLDAVLFKLSTLKKEEEEPEVVPLLSRVELELQMKELGGNDSGIEVFDSGKIEKDKAVLGDGQCMNGTSSSNGLKAVDENVL